VNWPKGRFIKFHRLLRNLQGVENGNILARSSWTEPIHILQEARLHVHSSKNRFLLEVSPATTRILQLKQANAFKAELPQKWPKAEKLLTLSLPISNKLTSTKRTRCCKINRKATDNISHLIQEIFCQGHKNTSANKSSLTGEIFCNQIRHKCQIDVFYPARTSQEIRACT
jgi:hypothetical protein